MIGIKSCCDPVERPLDFFKDEAKRYIDIIKNVPLDEESLEKLKEILSKYELAPGRYIDHKITAVGLPYDTFKNIPLFMTPDGKYHSSVEYFFPGEDKELAPFFIRLRKVEELLYGFGKRGKYYTLDGHINFEQDEENLIKSFLLVINRSYLSNCPN